MSGEAVNATERKTEMLIVQFSEQLNRLSGILDQTECMSRRLGGNMKDKEELLDRKAVKEIEPITFIDKLTYNIEFLTSLNYKMETVVSNLTEIV